MRKIAVAFLLLAFASRMPAAHAASPYDEAFDALVARYQLPGLAVGVIQDGKVVYMRTAGELVAGSGKPVTPDTLFKIASNSKSMTTALLARLVAGAKLDWNDPVIKYLPAFRMYDPWVTRNMQVRDLLVHNSGLREGAGDLMLWPEPNRFSRSDVIAGLSFLKPQTSFRSGYAYDNLMYVVAGEVAAAAGGAPYEQLVRREVFEPLNLTGCRVGEWRRDDVADVAQPHMLLNGRNVITNADAEIVAPITSAAAGGIRCSLRDMLTWAHNWLDPDAKQLAWLNIAQRRPLWTAQTPMPISERRREQDHGHFYAYGFGWRLADDDGVWNVSHTGTLSGMYSVVSLLPDKRSGFVMLTNGEGEDARDVMTQVLLKSFTAPLQHHTVAEYADALVREAAVTPARAADVSARKPATRLQMQKWLGVWRDPWFGEVSVCMQGDQVRLRSAKSPLIAGRVMQLGQRYLIDWDDAGNDAQAWLDFAKSNPASRMTMSKVDPKADFSFDYEDLSFKRVRDCD